MVLHFVFWGKGETSKETLNHFMYNNQPFRILHIRKWRIRGRLYIKFRYSLSGYAVFPLSECVCVYKNFYFSCHMTVSRLSNTIWR